MEKFNSADLDSELEAVRGALGVRPSKNFIYKLPSGVYVYVYGPNTIRSSSLRLSDADQFFQFDPPPLETTREKGN